MSKTPAPDWLTVKQAAETRGWTSQRIRSLARAGRLVLLNGEPAAFRFGVTWLVSPFFEVKEVRRGPKRLPNSRGIVPESGD